MTRARQRRETGSPSPTGGRRGAVRCAIYTRKSSEEGLEQDFNSLHAQREACEAFILSQRQEGWTALAQAYDDGGVSGGTMDRPALRRLLADIRSGQIDCVVVYKVDRLTRSLADFAKMVEIFDEHGVSFVSVTQQFNTTSSMGRLTLNVLLSFAQFEREVTGERIRDKIAASKQKGMWMGGFVPLGYEAQARSLVVNEAEAETVRRLYDLYRQYGNVRQVKDEADRLGLRSKRRVRPDGRSYGGVGFSRGAIYKILSNPIYVGEIAHRGKRYPGSHPALIDRQVWEDVQQQLSENAVRQKGQANTQSPSLLAGLIFDDAGEPLTPSHANKKGRRYRYYVSKALVEGKQDAATANNTWRLPASEIESLVLDNLREQLVDQNSLIDQLEIGRLESGQLEQLLRAAAELTDAMAGASMAEKRSILCGFVRRIEIAPERVRIHVDRPALLRELGGGGSESEEDDLFTIDLAIRLRRRGSELKLVLADREPPVHRDRSLIGILALGFLWFEELRTSAAESIAAIAEREKVSPRLVRRYCDLAFLSTDLVEAILAGEQPVELTSESFKQAYPLPMGWQEQRRVLGMR